MKVSLLLPTLFPKRAGRLIESAQQAGESEFEIVVCSPMEIRGAHVVWVRDTHCNGNNPANRTAFHNSAGEVIAVVQDKITLVEDWAAKLLSCVASKPTALWGLKTLAGRCCVFGHYYPFYPAGARSIFLEHFQFFYPYTAQWGDPAFALDVWRKGGLVKETPEQIIIEHGDTMGEGISPHKESSFLTDMRLFLRDFADCATGWDISNWRNFNCPG